MKRILALLLIFVFILSLSLSSCIAKPTEIPTENDVPAENIVEEIEDISEENEINAGVFWYDFSDAYLSTVRTALDAELTEAGIKFTNYDAAKTQSKQNDQIDTAISQGANILIVNIVDTADINAAYAIVVKAAAAGIPVIFFNREVYDDVINSYENACFVGTRAAETGERQGEMAGEYITANYKFVDLNGDGKISYILMHGGLCCGEPRVRAMAVDYANEIIMNNGYSGLTYYDDENLDKFNVCSWSKTTAFDTMELALTEHSLENNNMIEAVFAGNDDMALGCVEALNNIGWNTGDADDPYIPVFGIDYTADAQAAIEAGKMTGSILMSATGMAKTVAALAINVMNGEHVFANTENLNVDNESNKIRVPYEIKM